jgi:hypothetical protein
MVSETMKRHERKTEVDRSSGSVIYLRPEPAVNPENARTIYEHPSKGDQPDDLARMTAIDRAYTYLHDRRLEKDADSWNRSKVAFLVGVWIGMSIMYGLVTYLKMG